MEETRCLIPGEQQKNLRLSTSRRDFTGISSRYHTGGTPPYIKKASTDADVILTRRPR